MAVSSNFIYLIIAILLSPVLGVFASSIVRDIFLLFTLDFNSWAHNIPVFLLSGMARSILGLFVSLPVVLFYGVPVFYLLKKWNRQNVWMFGLFGLLPTGIGTLISSFKSNQALASLNTYSLSAGALDGCLTAIFFWLIAVYIPSHRGREG